MLARGRVGAAVARGECLRKEKEPGPLLERMGVYITGSSRGKNRELRFSIVHCELVLNRVHGPAFNTKSTSFI